MGAVLALMLNIVVAVLLAVMIIYCIKLNKRIRVLQDSKSELAQLIQRFDESTQKATVSINEIHKASKKINENIQARLDKANFLADDLAFMIEKGSKLADRMESDISGARGAAQGARPSPAGAAAAAAAAGSREPRGAMGGGAAGAGMKRPQRPAPETSGGAEPERMAAPERRPMAGAAGAAAPSGQRVPGVRMRSKAEQDLLDALKNKA